MGRLFIIFVFVAFSYCSVAKTEWKRILKDLPTTHLPEYVEIDKNIGMDVLFKMTELCNEKFVCKTLTNPEVVLKIQAAERKWNSLMHKSESSSQADSEKIRLCDEHHPYHYRRCMKSKISRQTSKILKYIEDIIWKDIIICTPMTGAQISECERIFKKNNLGTYKQQEEEQQQQHIIGPRGFTGYQALPNQLLPDSHMIFLSEKEK